MRRSIFAPKRWRCFIISVWFVRQWKRTGREYFRYNLRNCFQILEICEFDQWRLHPRNRSEKIQTVRLQQKHNNKFLVIQINVKEWLSLSIMDVSLRFRRVKTSWSSWKSLKLIRWWFYNRISSRRASWLHTQLDKNRKLPRPGQQRGFDQPSRRETKRKFINPVRVWLQMLRYSWQSFLHFKWRHSVPQRRMWYSFEQEQKHTENNHRT